MFASVIWRISLLSCSYCFTHCCTSPTSSLATCTVCVLPSSLRVSTHARCTCPRSTPAATPVHTAASSTPPTHERTVQSQPSALPAAFASASAAAGSLPASLSFLLLHNRTNLYHDPPKKKSGKSGRREVRAPGPQPLLAFRPRLRIVHEDRRR